MPLPIICDRLEINTQLDANGPRRLIVYDRTIVSPGASRVLSPDLVKFNPSFPVQNVEHV